jgi:hypothetical protein
MMHTTCLVFKEGDKLLICGHPMRSHGLLVIKAEVIDKFIREVQDLKDASSGDLET